MCLPEFRWGDQLGRRIRPRDRAWSQPRARPSRLEAKRRSALQQLNAANGALGETQAWVSPSSPSKRVILTTAATWSSRTAT